MSDYIKRENAVLAIAAFLRFSQPMARRIVDEIPSADVVDRESYESMERTVQKLTDAIAKTEQKHGKWIMSITEPVVGRICSNCGFAWSTQIDAVKLQPVFSNIKTAYCPNCGSRMDGNE